ncbi:PREDICTED: lysM and putative peptidoglycan-binding domain-containing protein 1 [Cyprinodon variegatus]|uniref:LysM and putative peptidoglycan-binding domain-containing protein 1 n=1 Tax=Cyprinodon variegatus TaxID=28743 RepID=A0A3Q2DAX4_CYPVA|nr:PREDICTED: lysM and putative peptidoglycan-binding domain-containing protein 1 [Cyprinodon variegatus]XP_015254452.1 PREDICTED: lysM and putative peptidoglycan-binding domain-containing protein 1 [Cyprinodon variegatus]
MSGERAPLPSGGGELFRGSRTRSYGSLTRSSLSPLRHRLIEHTVKPGETLQGLALKYGVTVEQIKRANRLYTNDSIFQKKSLSIPVLSDLKDCSNGLDLSEEEHKEGKTNGAPGQEDLRGRASDLTPGDFFKRLDDLISKSKEAAARGCQDAEKRVAALEAACSSQASDWHPLTRSQSLITSPRLQQGAPLGAVPLTTTKLTKKLKEREDEIFEL